MSARVCCDSNRCAFEARPCNVWWQPVGMVSSSTGAARSCLPGATPTTKVCRCRVPKEKLGPRSSAASHQTAGSGSEVNATGEKQPSAILAEEWRDDAVSARCVLRESSGRVSQLCMGEQPRAVIRHFE